MLTACSCKQGRVTPAAKDLSTRTEGHLSMRNQQTRWQLSIARVKLLLHSERRKCNIDKSRDRIAKRVLLTLFLCRVLPQNSCSTLRRGLDATDVTVTITSTRTITITITITITVTITSTVTITITIVLQFARSAYWIMEKKMETTIMETQLEKKMENKMETGMIMGYRAYM